MRRVGIAILGANGYMGRNAIAALPAAKGLLALQNVNLELIGLADPTYFDQTRQIAMADARAHAINTFGNLNPCSLFKDGESAISLYVDQGYRSFRTSQDLPDVTVIYDATPTNDRGAFMSQVTQAQNSEIFFLGEKPLVVDPAWFHRNEPRKDELPIFCDFIETSNPVVSVLRDTIRKGDDGQGLTIEAMHFWRTGASGLKHLVGHDQQGVQGGAILDKAAHDVSISTMLIEPDRIARFKVLDAEIHHLITQSNNGARVHLNASSSLTAIENLTFDYKSSASDRRLLPADGLSSFAIEWQLRDGTAVPATYVVGWLGYMGRNDPAKAHEKERYFVKKLESLGYPSSLWLMYGIHKGIKKGVATGKTCIETQARIAFVDVRDAAGKQSTLVANFIAHEAQNGYHAINRWVDWHTTDDDGRPFVRKLHTHSTDVYAAQKGTDLSNVIARVVLDCVGVKEAKYLGSRACYFVHRAMLEARDQALELTGHRMSKEAWDFAAAEEFIATSIQDS